MDSDVMFALDEMRACRDRITLVADRLAAVSPRYEETSQRAKLRVLVVDDEPADVELLSRILKDAVEVYTASTLAEMREILPSVRPDVVLLDLTFPDSLSPQNTVDKVVTYGDLSVVVVSAFANQVEIPPDWLRLSKEKLLYKGSKVLFDQVRLNLLNRIVLASNHLELLSQIVG